MNRQQNIIQSDYQISDRIYESANSLVYRAIIQPDNRPVILKILKENYPTPAELTRYKQEYEVTRALNGNGTIVAYDLQRYENSLIIFLEDFGGESLKLLMRDCQFTIAEFLTIAIKTTASLESIHATNIIHKDINPSNILYNPATKQLKIIDFGISSYLSRQHQIIDNLDRLEGTLAYIAPEQTGRMNRGIDYRSDFYSLGATFYELLANRLPFATTDPVELVHCHLAQQPTSPHELVETIPEAISDIVMKLLAKTPEQRYQSAGGIKADLETCLVQLQSLGKIDSFALASQDIYDRFHIPEQLYGREDEVARLLTTFERVSHGSTEIVLVSGYSGIGKSALVNEIHKPIVRQRGYFISGKFDQLYRDIPYAAISLAFQNLIRQLLGESESALTSWRQALLAALEPNAGVIIDVIPTLEQIIGKHPPIEQLGATEAQNRFNVFFQKFIGVFTKSEHPLVIFLDDLQWADLPSLQLIEQLITDTDSQYLLIVGAYRDNEVDATHPLQQTLAQITSAGASISNISLQPLDIEHIERLIADTLNCSIAKTKSLTELVAQKTQGNPFFLTQLLQSLYEDKFLSFDYQEKCWIWNIEEIERVEIADNVIDLTIAKISKLDKKTQQVLQLAACIGNQFNLEILCVVNNQHQTTTARELQPALAAGLVVPLSNNYTIPLLWDRSEISTDNLAIPEAFTPKIPQYIPYKFLHDRVQQAAYTSLSDDEKQTVHLQIGRLLLENNKESEIAENIFDIVNHLNKGIELIIDLTERDNLAKLNLQAGKKAKASTAHQPALQYLETSFKLLSAHSWEQQYGLTLEVHVEILELLRLNAEYDRVQALSINVLAKVGNTLDKLKVYESILLAHYANFEQKQAIDTALVYLSELGIDISPAESASEVGNRIDRAQQDFKLLLKGNNIASLVDLPMMTDPAKLAALQILQHIATATSTTNFALYIETILKQISLSIKYGNAPQAASIYSLYGMIISGIIKDIDTGYEYGKLAIKLQQKSKVIRLEPIVSHFYYGCIWHWKECLRNKEAQKHLSRSYQVSS